MLWFVLVRKLPNALNHEFKIAQLNTSTLRLHDQYGWHVVLGGFHSRLEADEAYQALILPSTLDITKLGEHA